MKDISLQKLMFCISKDLVNARIYLKATMATGTSLQVDDLEDISILWPTPLSPLFDLLNVAIVLDKWEREREGTWGRLCQILSGFIVDYMIGLLLLPNMCPTQKPPTPRVVRFLHRSQATSILRWIDKSHDKHLDGLSDMLTTFLYHIVNPNT